MRLFLATSLLLASLVLLAPGSEARKRRKEAVYDYDYDYDEGDFDSDAVRRDGSSSGGYGSSGGGDGGGGGVPGVDLLAPLVLLGKEALFPRRCVFLSRLSARLTVNLLNCFQLQAAGTD